MTETKAKLSKEEIEKIAQKTKEEILKATINIRDLKTLDDFLEILPQPIEIKDVSLIYEKIEEKVNPLFGNLEVNILFKIFKTKLGTGNEPIFIYTEPNFSLLNGSKVLIKQLTNDEVKKILSDYKLREIISKSLKLKENEPNLENKIKFFKVIDELPEELFLTLIEKDGIFNEIVEKIIDKDRVDRRIYYLNLMRFLNFSNKVERKYQRFQPHALLNTNTKVGKTLLAEMLHGENCVYNSGRVSRFLGYSTADESHPSELDNRIDPVFCDEITSKSWEELIFDALPNLLENGFSNVAKGSKSVKAKTLCAFTFMTNTKKFENNLTPRDLLMDFETFINKFTEAPQRIGSRIGIILFGTNFKTIKGTLEFDDKLVWLFKQICKKINELISKLLEKREILSLLDSEIEGYVKQIDVLINNLPETSVKSFWNGNKEAFRHINGGAFLLAVLEYVRKNQKVLVNHEIDFNELKEMFQEWRNEIIEWNLQSLKEMIGAIPNELEYLKLKFESIETEYIRLLILTISNYAIKNQKLEKGVLIPLDLFRPSFDDLPQNVKKGRYTFFSRLKEKIPKEIEKLNNILIPFGFRLDIVRIKDTEECCVVFENDKILFFAQNQLNRYLSGEVREIGEATPFTSPNSPSSPTRSVSNYLEETLSLIRNKEKMLGLHIPEEDVKKEIEEKFGLEWQKVKDYLLKCGYIMIPKPGFISLVI